MKKIAYLLLFVIAAGACNVNKTVDPTGKGPIPKGVKAAQKDTSVTGRKDTTRAKPM